MGLGISKQPWKPQKAGCFSTVVDAEGTGVLRGVGPMGRSAEEYEANVTMAGYSPKLLHALTWVINCWNGEIEGDDPTYQIYDAMGEAEDLVRDIKRELGAELQEVS